MRNIMKSAWNPMKTSCLLLKSTTLQKWWFHGISCWFHGDFTGTTVFFFAISSRPFFPRTPAALIASVTAAEILTMWQVAWYSAEVVAKNVGYLYGNYHWYMVPSIDMVYGKYHIYTGSRIDGIFTVPDKMAFRVNIYIWLQYGVWLTWLSNTILIYDIYWDIYNNMVINGF